MGKIRKSKCPKCGSKMHLLSILEGVYQDTSCFNRSCTEHGYLHELANYDIGENYQYHIGDADDY